MKKWPMPVALPLAQLLLDIENPRVETQTSQRSAIKALLESQSDRNKTLNKVVELAISISINGYSTAEPLIVLPHLGKYIVLEGNRRLLALKLLLNPELSNGIVSQKNKGRLATASSNFNINDKFEIPCVQVVNREEADSFIQPRHTGENNGVGLVRWNRKEIGRYKERLGHKPLDLQVIDFLRTSVDVSASIKDSLDDVPGTTLIRFVKDLKVRQNLGLDIKDDILDVSTISAETAQVLALVANNLATGKANTNTVRNATDRMTYLDLIKKEISDRKIARAVANRNTLPKKSNKRVQLKSSKERTTLVPPDCTLSIPQTRLNDIFVEMTKINPHDFPNLSSAILRIFLELSLDEYISSCVTWRSGKYSTRISLHDKILAVEEHMRNNLIMDNDELLPIKRMASNDNWLCSKNTMHGFIHNRHYQPVPADIILIWNNLQNLFEKMWPLTEAS